MTTARVEAAARLEYNLNHGLDADDYAAWDAINGDTRAQALARAEATVAAIDAADDRIRLTLPEFNAIKADTVYNLSHDLHQSWTAEQRAAAQAAGIPEFIEAHRARLGESYLEPVDHESAMASLISERLAAALRSTAESFDHASLSDITGATETPPGVSARYKRIMISGCADWLRNRAADLESDDRIPYRRVNTRAVIDEDRQTALLGALGRVIARSQRLRALGKEGPAFIMTDRLVEAIEETGATIPAES